MPRLPTLDRTHFRRVLTLQRPTRSGHTVALPDLGFITLRVQSVPHQYSQSPCLSLKMQYLTFLLGLFRRGLYLQTEIPLLPVGRACLPLRAHGPRHQYVLRAMSPENNATLLLSHRLCMSHCTNRRARRRLLNRQARGPRRRRLLT